MRCRCTGGRRRRRSASVDRIGSRTGCANWRRPDRPLEVRQWPKQLQVGPEENPPTAARYDDLAATAEDAGANLAPFFHEEAAVGGRLQGDAGGRVITFPVLAVVVECAGETVGLYPCHRGGTHHRVEDAVDALAAATVPDNLTY